MCYIKFDTKLHEVSFFTFYYWRKCTKKLKKSIQNVTKSLLNPNSVCKKYTDNI